MFTKDVFNILLFCSLIAIVLCQSRRFFDERCPFDAQEQIRKCRIHVDNMLDFTDFRQWTSGLPTSVKVSLEVFCSSIGRFYLPWPMKAIGLIRLKVTGCQLEGFWSELNTPTNIMDEMEELSLVDCVCLSNVDNIFDILYGNITLEYDCGQQSLYSSVKRNMTYTFPQYSTGPLSEHQEHLLMSGVDQLMRKAKQKNYRCRYPNLGYIDDTTSRSRSKYYLPLMTAYSDYPKLQTFLISDNGYSRIPHELVEWRTSFPQLTYLDMSHNSVTTFDFLGTQFNMMPRRNEPLFVDLSHNVVTNIPLNMINYVRNTVPIIIDLKDNPLKCHCSFLIYKNYIGEVIFKFPMYTERLSAIKCYSSVERRQIGIAAFKDVSCTI